MIQGDNLAALKSLLPFYAGQVKCIFIDPPYNTKNAFAHYDDNLEHSLWLSLMYPRLELLRELLAEDGSIWVTLDDNESHYFKVMMDEIFGRSNFVANVVWQKFHSVKRNSKYGISQAHDHILVYKKSDKLLDFNFLDMDSKALSVYKNPDNDPRGRWRTAPLTVSLLSGARGAAYAKTGQSTGLYEIISPTGKVHLPSKGRCWISRSGFDELLKDNRIYWGKDGNAVPMKKVFLEESGGKKITTTFWEHNEVGSNKTANEEQKALSFDNNAFPTPKPEALLQRILHLATNENDLILDSFLGSGTTAAVAHKMNRRYIGIEIGEHAKTHVVPRLKKVIEGEQGGISKAVNWQGGGGFRFCELGETVFDEWGAINSSIKFDDLAAHIWYTENHFPLPALQKNAEKSPLIGVHNGKAFYLLFNGILGDKRPQGGNVLTSLMLKALPRLDELVQAGLEIVVYGESCRLASKKLAEYHITFKLIPHDVSAK
ncbi:site-specific DNA-methyltransferase [[Haemophilus] felis]|nr:site-specific DNA-methyltransferase [[Haemophilus] felis]